VLLPDLWLSVVHTVLLLLPGGFNISLEPGFSASRLAWLAGYNGVYAQVGATSSKARNLLCMLWKLNFLCRVGYRCQLLRCTVQGTLHGQL
jgi:hypothetical protein